MLKKSAVGIILLFIFCTFLSAQDTFIKTVNDPNSGVKIRILPTNDQGWVLFTLDSLKMYKYNSCGIFEWSKKYDLQIGAYAGNIIRTANGGFVLLNRYLKNSVSVTLLTRLDASGNILWNKSYGDLAYDHYPYTVNEDAGGNFILYGNISHISSSLHYNILMKVNSNGNLLWTKGYNQNPIWGGAILTSDNGILARTGSTFIKTDQAGNVQWTSVISSSGSFYLAPIEVSDGYIYNNFENGSNQISFYKIDNQGNQVWGGRKLVSFFGYPLLMHKTNNGNFVCVFNKFIGLKKYPTVVEFDKELNVINQSSLNSPITTEFLISDICLINSSTSVLTGMAIDNNAITSLYFAKLDNQYHSGCDTTISFNSTSSTITQSFIPTSVISFNFNTEDESFLTSNSVYTQSTLCSNLIPLQLNLGIDTTVCPGTNLTLNNSTGDVFDDYKWSTGATSSTIDVTLPGTYSLTATYHCGQDTARDSVTVAFVDFTTIVLETDTSICSTEPLVLNAELSGATYKWQDGSSNPTYDVTVPGNYFVDVTSKNCLQRFNIHVTDCEQITMPNVFTPNGDQLNDHFIPMEMKGIVSAALSIYNRWGEKIYSTTDLLKGWDGSVSSKKYSSGVYFWEMSYSNYRSENKFQKGTVQLMNE